MQALYGRVAIASRIIAPGDAASFQVETGQLLQIVTVSGRQVAELVAFNAAQVRERLSPAATRTRNKSIMLEVGKKLYSTRFQPMLEIVSDSVGRHDLLMATTEPVKPSTYEQDGEEELTHALVDELTGFGITLDDIPDTVNFFANISIKSKGELAIDESLAEANDSVMLKALTDVVVGIGCRKGMAGSGITASDLIVRVFR